MKKKILFISSVNLSTNPRILKEIKLAQALGHEVTFLGFYLGNWSDELDKDLLKGLPLLTALYLDATRKNFVRWLRHSLQERFNSVIWKLNRSSVFLAATACTKRTFALVDYGKTVRPGDFDLVIGHTLGALYPASAIAQQAACAYAFDVEDFHPGEHIDADIKNEKARRELIMKRILPAARYVSASSPLIGDYTKNLCRLEGKKLISVLNFFPSAEFKPPVAVSGHKIRLIWFSQFISRGRGLEILLSGWSELKNDFELTLVGDPDSTFREAFQDEIEILNPLPQIKLHELIGKYDVGLALDLSSRDLNRDLALTNKILAYCQAGLYILATDTAAQKDFLQEHPVSGTVFAQNDHRSLLAALNSIRGNIETIRSEALKRYQHASADSWEQESRKLSRVWEASLN